MKSMMRTLKWALGVALFVAAFASLSNAQCMKLNVSKLGASLLKPQSLSHMTGPAAFAPVAQGLVQPQPQTNQDPMVGFWYVTFTSDDPGVFFDWGYTQFHSDGTEILNSGTGPGKFCLGVWKRTGNLKYTLNHFPIFYLNDTFIGIINIREDITVSGDHDSFTGRFTMNIYDPSGTLLDPSPVSGNLEGHRITVDTPFTDVLPATAP